jgi:hypothetical protein
MHACCNGALALGLAALAIGTGQAAAEHDRVRFELCGRILASVEVGRFDGPQPWAVLVQLAPQDAESFRAATAAHPGAALDITHGARVLVSGTISGEIRTGLISATYATKEDADAARRALTEKSAAHCAAVPSHPPLEAPEPES